MSDEKYKFAITPQLGVNDRNAVLVNWHVANGEEVRRGQPICCLETSKATVDVEAEFDGIFKILVDVKEVVDINQPLGAFFVDQESYDQFAEGLYNNLVKKPFIDEFKATTKAIRLAQELGIDLLSIGIVGIIREIDVQNFSRMQDEFLANVHDINLHPTLKNVAIYGSGRGAYTIFENINLGNEYHVACFLDDDASKVGQKEGLPVIHSRALGVDERLSNLCVALGVSDSDARRRVTNRCNELGIDLINIVHPQAWVAPSVKMGTGNHIKAGAVIDTRSEICDGCIIDNNTIIPHDNLIESFCHLAPGVILGSGIVIGESTIVGIGASVATGVKIGANCIVGVGSAVTKNIPNGSVVEGVPARVVGHRRGNE